MKYFIDKSETLVLDKKARSMLSGNFIKLSDGVTHYKFAGPEHGELVILVGGLTVPLFYWDRLASLLHKAGYRTLAYSAYGRGYSDRLSVPYGDKLFVRQLHELIKALNISTKNHILSASMGALIAMGYCKEHAESVSSLTIAGPAGLSRPPVLLRLIMRSNLIATLMAKTIGRKWLKSHESNDLGDKTHERELSAMLRDAFQYQGSIHAVFDTLQNFGLFSRQSLYRAVAEKSIPSLLIWGQDDQVTPIDKIDDARHFLCPQRTHVVACGHMVPFERPEIVSSQFQSFLESKT
jgi:pimeloyl-ACP methyl ester carboxylesterase